MATGTIRPEIVMPEQIGGRTFFYTSVTSTTTVTIETLSSIVGAVLFCGSGTASRNGAYILFFNNSTTEPLITPIVAASGITLTPSEGKITITASGTSYLSIMCMYEVTVNRIKVTKI